MHHEHTRYECNLNNLSHIPPIHCTSLCNGTIPPDFHEVEEGIIIRFSASFQILCAERALAVPCLVNDQDQFGMHMLEQ